MFYELVQNLKSFKFGNDRYKFRLYVGHDGSMIRLASGNVVYEKQPNLRIQLIIRSAGLGFGRNGPLRWPAMGSEIILEVWQTETMEDFVRVIHEGMPVPKLEWIPLSGMIDTLEEQIPDRIYQTCMRNS